MILLTGQCFHSSGASPSLGLFRTIILLSSAFLYFAMVGVYEATTTTTTIAITTTITNVTTNNNNKIIQRTCYNYGYTNGQWIIDNNRKNNLFPNKPVYRWNVTSSSTTSSSSSSCSLELWSKQKFCDVLKKIKNKDNNTSKSSSSSLLIVGDSINQNLFDALVIEYNVALEDVITQRYNETGPHIYKSFVMPCNNNNNDKINNNINTIQPLIKVTSIRNDWLTIDNITDVQPDKDHNYYNVNWIDYVKDHDIILFNTGVHTRSIDLYKTGMIELKKFLQQYTDEKIILFRTTPRGHIDCSFKVDKYPITSINTTEYNKFFNQSNETLPLYYQYHYDWFPQYNTILKDEMSDIATIIDVAPMMELRPDVHKCRKHDWVHYKDPTVYDIWFQLILNALQGNI